MKLLFDQNLSFKLCQSLADLYPGSSQVRSLGLAEADDRSVWEHAKANAFVLVTQDSDFADMAALYGHPPSSGSAAGTSQPRPLKNFSATTLRLLKPSSKTLPPLVSRFCEPRPVG